MPPDAQAGIHPKNRGESGRPSQANLNRPSLFLGESRKSCRHVVCAKQPGLAWTPRPTIGPIRSHRVGRTLWVSRDFQAFFPGYILSDNALHFTGQHGGCLCRTSNTPDRWLLAGRPPCRPGLVGNGGILPPKSDQPSYGLGGFRGSQPSVALRPVKFSHIRRWI